jgi:hypothetical protein
MKRLLTEVYVILSVMFGVWVVHSPIQHRIDEWKERATVARTIHEICVSANDWFEPTIARPLQSACETRYHELWQQLTDRSVPPLPSPTEWIGIVALAVLVPLLVYAVIWSLVTGAANGWRRLRSAGS